MNPTRTDYDSPWKDLLEHYFQPFMTQFFPHAAQDIDWNKGHEFLDKELQKVARKAEAGRRYADKLVKVWRRGGEETWVLVHIEVQAQPETDFAERMFTYYYRLFDRYRRPLASFAVLADDRPDWRPERYRRELWHCAAELTFPSVKVLDYQDQPAVLEASDNPFALVIRAHLAARQTRTDPEQRLASKLTLTRLLYQQGWRKTDVLNLYRFIDWILALPEPLELEYLDNVHRLEEETRMRYVTSAERIGRKQGLQQGLEKGLQQGLEKGLQQGLLQGEARVIHRQLQRRFGLLPDWVGTRLRAADEPQLERWAERLLEARTLAEVFEENEGG